MEHMIGIKDKFLDFRDIKEIKFTRVGDNTYSISIQSDIEMDNKTLKDSIFESRLCTLDSALTLYFQNEYTNAWFGKNPISSKCFSIPLDIKILLDTKEQKFFTITTKSNE